ncbi:19903_t:CDS:2 [Racocetra fulgida]|uniref:19903_t:CDS:1 n=1 Tax=Racocetra fulgida TaxID=60492 RepID=A0A9N9C6N1_9GLOM|nr:19903_t:CDS:2 [Racocetra fulgida]
MPYVAPEVLQGKPFSQAADIYSLGIIMTEIATGKRAFDGIPFDLKLSVKICRGERPEFNEGIPECYITLAKRCMDPDPKKRPIATIIDSKIDVAELITNLPETDLYIEYANSTVNSTSDGEGDITISLAKLSFSIDNLNKQLHDQDLILQAAGIRDLEIVLNSVKEGIKSLNISLDRLQIASDLLRKVVRFFYLVKCLENHLVDIGKECDKGNECIKAASSISELGKQLYMALLKDVDFEGIDLVQTQLPKVRQSKIKISDEAFRLLSEGIDNKKEADITLGLQIFYELNEMGERVSKYVDDIFAKLLDQMRNAIDSASLQKEIKG